MLTRREFRYNYYLMKFLSALKLCPLDIDHSKGIIKVQQSPLKRCLCFGVFGVSLLHGCYIHLRLLQALLNQIDSARHHLVFHVNLSLTSLMVQSWYTICFLQYPETLVALLNDVFPVGRGQEPIILCPAPQIRRSLQEWLVLAQPMFFVEFLGLLLGLACYDRTMAFLLYSSLPEDYKSPVWFLLLLCQEALFLALLAGNAIIVLNTQLLFFEKITSSLKILNSSLLGSMYPEDSIERAYGKLRELQLKIGLFNMINRNIVVSFKLFCIIATTLCGYYTIAYFSDHPIFGCINGCLFLIQSTLYTVMYERAFIIPELVSLTKSTVLQRTTDAVQMAGFKRITEMRVRSVPEVGIQVGRFHTFERVAALVFLDYVLRNVVTLLVMHSKN